MVEINGKYFDWDVTKNLTNIEKHGVSFKMAASSFFDPNAVIIDDEVHSQGNRTKLKKNSTEVTFDGRI